MKRLEDISRREFQAYERIRRSGKFNMITHGHLARSKAHLGTETYSAILVFYEKLVEKWPEVRETP